jgi:DNA-binding transcriptional MerR regulator
MGMHQPIRKIVTPEIPDKLYFRIGDVARLCEVPAYVLRFWETEFPQLKPNKGGTGQRLYRKRDVEMALRIKSLLYDQGYTIPGARQVFKVEVKAREATAMPVPEPGPGASGQAEVPTPVVLMGARPDAAPGTLGHEKQLGALRAEMRSLLGMLSRPVSSAHPTAEGKVKAMRPRLVVEAKPAVKAETDTSASAQRDLFGGE